MRQHGLRDAAQQQPPDDTEAARAQNDEIRPAVLDVPHNHVGWLTGEQSRLDRGQPRAKARRRRGQLGLQPAHRRRFPKSLHGAPVLLPATNTATRRSIDQWLEAADIRPDIIGEFEDSELLWEFGAAGEGIFPVPTVLERQLTRLHGVKVLGRTDAVRSRFYAISVERRLKHPAVVAICETARRELFGGR